MDVSYVYSFILCLCCPVYRSRPCDELITRPRSPTVCKDDQWNWEINTMLQSGREEEDEEEELYLTYR
jgi:hypothetical protein